MMDFWIGLAVIFSIGVLIVLVGLAVLSWIGAHDEDASFRVLDGHTDGEK